MHTRLNHLGQPVGTPLPDWHGAQVPARTPMQAAICRLEPLDPDRHAADLFAAFTEDAGGRIWTYLGYGPFSDRAAFDAWAQRMSAGDDPLFFAIVDRASEEALGVASFLRIDAAAGAIEVGHINYSPRLQRSRLATEAMYLMMSHVFDDLGYRRYEWKCDALNAGSRRAAARLGFRYEGLFRQALVYKGRNRDTTWFSIVDSEWPALKSAYDLWLADANFDADGRQRTSLTALIARLGERGS